EPAPLGLADAGPVARGVVGRTPASLRVEARERFGEELLLPGLSRPAPAGTCTVSAPHDAETLPTYPHLDHPHDRQATQPPAPTSSVRHPGTSLPGRSDGAGPPTSHL